MTAPVHPGTGAPGSRRLGRGDAGERDRLRRLPATPPELAPVVADAGHHGHDPAAAMLGAGASFLIRMPSSVRLFVDRPADPGRSDHGPVTYWPLEARQERSPPLRPRPIRVRPRREARGGRRRADVRLLTDVLSPRRLSAERAGRLYRRRRENEGLSRTCKRTLAKVHLTGRSVRAVHREASGSLLACQPLLAQGAWASEPGRATTGTAGVCSARRAALAIRREPAARRAVDGRSTFPGRLARCRRDRRPGTGDERKRERPRRAPHRPPRPPTPLTMNAKGKALHSGLSSPM